ncbi:MAG: hypothetical protein U5K35_12560 [Rhodohalobacter sp.]|nr:hypothetical protein [Rhodohalobacter sp.]
MDTRTAVIAEHPFDVMYLSIVRHDIDIICRMDSMNPVLTEKQRDVLLEKSEYWEKVYSS